MIIDIPKSSLAMIMTTSSPGYDIKISEATSRPNVMKPNTPGDRDQDVSDIAQAGALTRRGQRFGLQLTGESVDE